MDSRKCITHLGSMAVTSSIRFSSHSSNKPTTMESWHLSLLTICNQDRAVNGLRISICRNCRTKRADNTLSKIKLETTVKLFSLSIKNIKILQPYKTIKIKKQYTKILIDKIISHSNIKKKNNKASFPYYSLKKKKNLGTDVQKDLQN